ncbi:MAG: helix-turn-helix domain-containing protein [Deltaproteobacteria bacterium]|nr:helix-turn-helix domain-containing protein [Deltaproteobacteria bacterium]
MRRTRERGGAAGSVMANARVRQRSRSYASATWRDRSTAGASHRNHAARIASQTAQPNEELGGAGHPAARGSARRRSGMSTRTFSRRFSEQVGTSPTQWILRARVRRAQQLLERTKHAMSRVADDCGFGSIAAFRAHFQRVVGTSPRSYRAAFR